MKTSEAFPSKYLKASDLLQPATAVIKLVATEELKGFGGKQESKQVAFFARGLKPLVLNRTNWEKIADISGSDESDDWAGTKLELYATTTSMNGKTIDCVRVRAPGEAQEKPKKTKAVWSPSDDDKPELDDEIPEFA